jgi:hypothetical protein
MQVSVARRVERRPVGELGVLVLLGLGTGIAAGFLFGEVFGRDGHRRVGRLIGRIRRRQRPLSAAARAEVVTRVSQVLQADPALAAQPIEVRAAQRNSRARVELRGWVTTRGARALAARLARAAAGAGLDVTNHLLVRGEDDG